MGITNTRATIEKSKPPVVPTAKENQKSSVSLSIKKGTKPRTVESTVRKTGMIL